MNIFKSKIIQVIAILGLLFLNSPITYADRVPVGGGSGTPAGSNGQLQYNNNGAFGGATGITYISGSSTITVATTSDSALFPYNSIIMWGDSQTQGGPSGATGGTFTQATATIPAQLNALTGYGVKNFGSGGYTSTQIKDRFLLPTSADYYNYPTIIWSGNNDTNSSSTILANIATMVAKLKSPARYLIIGVINTQAQASNTQAYANILSDNVALQATYPNNFLDIRPYVISQYNPSLPQDVIDHANQVPPTSLMATDGIHYNFLGSYIIAAKIATMVPALLGPSSGQVVTYNKLSSVLASPPVIGANTPQDGFFKALYAGGYFASTSPTGGVPASDNFTVLNLKGFDFRTSSAGSTDGTTDSFTPGLEKTSSGNWTQGPWTGSQGAGFTGSSTNQANLSETVGTTAGGGVYQITMTSSGSFGGGYYDIYVGGTKVCDPVVGGCDFVSSGVTVNTTVEALDTSGIVITPVGGFTGTISNISLKSSSCVVNSAPENCMYPMVKIYDSLNKLSSEMRFGSSTLANNFVGLNSGISITNGNNNVGFGSNALLGLGAGINNVAIGSGAMTSQYASFDNIAIGKNAMNNTGNTPGTSFRNIAIGTNAMSKGYNSTFNVAVGWGTLQNITTGSGNMAFGDGALGACTTCANNVAIGRLADNLATVIQADVAVGYGALQNSTAAVGQNTAIGYQALNVSTSAGFNVALGTFTGNHVTTGQRNTLIGYNTATDITTGGDNIALGDAITFASTTNSNQMNIGNLIYGTGNGTGNTPAVAARVGIATSTPIYQFTIASTTNTSSLNFAVDSNGNQYGGGKAPTVACASTCTLDTNAHDSSGTIQISGSQTVVTLTFGTAKPWAPHCVITDNVTTLGYDASSTPTTLVMTTGLSIGTANISYVCQL